MADQRKAAQREPFAIVYLNELPNLAQLTRDELLVYLWAVGRIRANPSGSWSAAATQIQAATGLRSVRQVRRCLSRLRQLGVLVNLAPVNRTARWAIRDMPARGDILVRGDENVTLGVTSSSPQGDENVTPRVTSSSPINETSNPQINLETATQEIEEFWDRMARAQRFCDDTLPGSAPLKDLQLLQASAHRWAETAVALGWRPSAAALAAAGRRPVADWWREARERCA